jgi:uncharacterized protein (DUF2141 family)
MKYTILLVSFLYIMDVKAQKSSSNLTVIISNLQNTKGEIEVGLFRNAENFADPKFTFKTIRAKVTGNKMSVVFHKLEEGVYSICIFHDENNNNICDRNFFGFPTEPYGFSNNARPIFSVPSFERCSIKLKTNTTISIKNTF